MKIGLLLPTFRDDAESVLAIAREASAAGLDGAFCYDHLWPMGSPTRPALAPFPLLAALAQREPELVIGPLVARVGLGGFERLRQEFATLHALAPGRVVAALGTGDRLSREENEAYGLAYGSSEQRRGQLRDLARSLRDEMEVWVGAGAPATNEIAVELHVTLNLWNASVEQVREASRHSRVTWAGDLSGDVGEHLDALAEAGAAWAVASTNVAREALYEWQRGRGISSVT
ncbi:MAG TPA: LLM class flavin-dependent oxidoreductase [Acidimicrobiales bacterium]|nr:LLM class flavin-dependent oxidoreductase [Acidimicrobiales bacterium]